MVSVDVGAVLAGRFRLDRKLGQGGMGAVFQATDLRLKRFVAIKTLLAEGAEDQDTLSRFATEARAIGALAHPNIGALLDFHGALDPVPFLVLEYIEGESLRSLLSRNTKLPAARAVHIAQQMLAALSAAHAAGTIHRDIKPSNVMMVPGTAVQDFVRVIDFGVARVAESVTRQHRTHDGAILGTPPYMAPEQAMGQPVHAGVDVYAVAVCLFEMIAGYNPFAVGKPVFVFAAVRDVVPPLLSQVEPSVPRALSDVVAKQLSKLPAARYRSAAEFSAALANAVEAAPAADITLRDAAPTLSASFRPSLPPHTPPLAPELPFASTVQQRAAAYPLPSLTPSAPTQGSAPIRPLTLLAGAALLVVLTAALTAGGAYFLLGRAAAPALAASSSAASSSAASSATPAVATLGATPRSVTSTGTVASGTAGPGVAATRAPARASAAPRPLSPPPPDIPVFDRKGNCVCDVEDGIHLCGKAPAYRTCTCVNEQLGGLCIKGEQLPCVQAANQPPGGKCAGTVGENGERAEGIWHCWFNCDHDDTLVRGKPGAVCTGYDVRSISDPARAMTTGRVMYCD
jgi:serine/threonine-protein kinase